MSSVGYSPTPEVSTNYMIEAPDDPNALTDCISCKDKLRHHNVQSLCPTLISTATALAAPSIAEIEPCANQASIQPSASAHLAAQQTTTLPFASTALLYKYERDMAHFASLLGLQTETAEWNHRAEIRREAINKYLWNASKGIFYDYNFITQQQSTYNYITTFYPLWAGLATPQQAAAVDQNLKLFERDGGLATSDTASGTQWDLPFGWAPTNWLATKGLEEYGFTQDASRIAQKFSETVLENFSNDGTIREKYNVVSGSANVQVATGYKSNVVGFGWTNGVYLQMNDLLTHSAKQPIATSTTQH